MNIPGGKDKDASFKCNTENQAVLRELNGGVIPRNTVRRCVSLSFSFSMRLTCDIDQIAKTSNTQNRRKV